MVGGVGAIVFELETPYPPPILEIVCPPPDIIKNVTSARSAKLIVSHGLRPCGVSV